LQLDLPTKLAHWALHTRFSHCRAFNRIESRDGIGSRAKTEMIVRTRRANHRQRCRAVTFHPGTGSASSFKNAGNPYFSGSTCIDDFSQPAFDALVLFA